MATSLASDKPTLPIPSDGAHDPFVSTTPISSHHRYSNFDHDLFAAGPGSSPRQAKRALEAHLAETERRLEEAGKLGTALVSQRKALTEQLQEVETLQAAGDMSPELRQKLVEIEKDYNDLARETARAFLPKSRVPSNETTAGSPFAPDSASAGPRSGRRSVSPSKFESQATGSPTKLTVPNRKIRNLPSNRVHDIEFAAEISTSLITQVRNLQAMLAERDEELKDIKFDRSKLEIDAENLQQRLKTLDESENRYKEENWNLETRLQEIAAQQKEAADREKKLTQALNTIKAEKSSMQRDLDEVRVTHARLIDQHAAAVKQHDIELGTAKRNMLIADGEKAAMQRRIDDLTSQNHELARAFAMTRGRPVERELVPGISDEDLETTADNITPEHSPPQSPMKGTPRHAMLETETLKSSLQHAQRTIQSQRSLLHREKTEKLEMRRIIQDLRDDLEKARSEQPSAPVAPRRPRKQPEPRDFKKPPRLLGSFRSSRQEIVQDDGDWEDHTDTSPRSVKPAASPSIRPSIEVDDVPTESGDNFETANETTDAFETANERATATETEDFQTGHEGLTGTSDDTETETEGVSLGFGRMRKPPSIPASMARGGLRGSFDSTASTSGEEDDFPNLRTPTATISSQRSGRRRLSRGTFSRSRQVSEEPNVQSSPGSFADTAQGHQSLFAELQEFDGSDSDSLGPVSPSRRSIRSITPGSTRRAYSPPPAVPPLPKVIMVDSGVMTDPVQFYPSLVEPQRLPSLNTGVKIESDDDRLSVSPISVVHHDRPLSSRGSVIAPSEKLTTVPELESDGVDADDRPLSMYSDSGAQYDPEIEQKLAQFPTPPTTQSILPPPPELSLSTILSEGVEPREEVAIPPAPPALSFTSILHENVEPVAEPEIPTPDLTLSMIVVQDLEPLAEPEKPLPELAFATLLTEVVEPIVEPQVPAPVLGLSAISTQSVVPVPEPEVEPLVVVPPPPQLSMSQIMREQVEPVEAPDPEEVAMSIPVPVVAQPPQLSMSSIMGEHVEPIAPVAPLLGLSSIVTETVEPISELEKEIPLPSLTLTPVHVEHWEPAPTTPAALTYSMLSMEQVEPVFEPVPFAPTCTFSPIATESVRPVLELPVPPALVLSPIAAQGVEPISPVREELVIPNFGFSTIESIETRPITPRSPKRNGFIMPRDMDSSPSDQAEPETPPTKIAGSILGRIKNNGSYIIAEDETRQSPRDTPEAETPESRRPFKEISSNSNARPARKASIPTLDQGAQTSLTAGAIDELFRTRSISVLGHHKAGSVGSVGSPGTIGTTGTVRIHRSDSFDTPVRNKGNKVMSDAGVETGSIRRPNSAASGKVSMQDVPPLPSNHRQAIEAARTGSAHGSQTNMGPPLWPASALRPRPVTPNQARPLSPLSARGTPTPRAPHSDTLQGRTSPTKLMALSRQSSVSSFASEIDSRFNMRHSQAGMVGFGPNTDPRMIQAITQTMIGEYLWKYTRKAGRGRISENRHRRYFWVHPYTRTLYWSDRDPSTGGRSELRAKSVPIEAVRVVTDDNPMPPGLHRKSLVIVSPGRTIKFTCTTGQRHETWFNALSYLLLRTTDEGQVDTEEMAENITREDVDEFNPQYGRSVPNGARPQAAPSLSSYNSRTTRNESPALGMSMNIPTLTPKKNNNNSSSSTATQQRSSGTLSKISGYWKSSQTISGTFSSRRSRAISGQDLSFYEASEVHDSAEDLRQMIEQQDRESDRLENVRACCDGKHDVGTLHHHSGKKLRATQAHSHPGRSLTPTPMASTRTRS